VIVPATHNLCLTSCLASGMLPYVERLYISLLNIIQSSKVPASVTENAAVALGRLGLGSCDELAPHLESFAYPFLDALAKVAETDEKDTALKGFCMVVGRNPEAMESCLIPFFRAIARYKEPSVELENLFRQVCTPMEVEKLVLTIETDCSRLSQLYCRL
jgi:transportin-1